MTAPQDIGNLTKILILTSTRFDFAGFGHRKRSDAGPGHSVAQLAEEIGAEILQPGDHKTVWSDRLLAKIVGTSEHWATARHVIATAEETTVIYATGDDVGLPLALVAAFRRSSARIGIYFLAPERTRAKWLARVVAVGVKRLFVTTGTPDKARFLENLIGSRVEQVVLAVDQTDTDFFSPRLPPEQVLTSPLIASCGLEQRDYITLAKATEALDLFVKVCAASPNYTDQTALAIPDPLPANMELRHLEFNELRSLYRAASITVIPLLANNFSAGLTTMLEAIACGSPVIISKTPGLASEMICQDLVVGVPPGDAAALQDAIAAVLDDPAEAQLRAKRAREWVLENHSTDSYVGTLAEAIGQKEQ